DAPALASPADRARKPFRGPPRSTRLYAYDDSFHAKNPDAPALDATLVAAVRGGRSPLRQRVMSEGHAPYEVLVRMPWREGPCAFILARRDPFVSTSPMRAFPPAEAWVVPVVVVLMAVFLAVGPIVQRIRKLTLEIQTSASQQYRSSISSE